MNLHSIRFSYVFVRFFMFLLLLDKICAFSSAFLCVHIRTNQTVTYWTKVFRKIFFVKGYSSISKYRSYRSYTKLFEQNFCLYITVYLVRIWTYKNADEKAHTFSRRSKNVKKRTKTYEKRILCKFTLKENTKIRKSIPSDQLKITKVLRALVSATNSQILGDLRLRRDHGDLSNSPWNRASGDCLWTVEFGSNFAHDLNSAHGTRFCSSFSCSPCSL